MTIPRAAGDRVEAGRPSILHVAGLRRWGGIATLVRELAAHQRHQQRLNVAVLSSLSGSREQTRALRHEGVPIYEVGLSGAYDLRPGRYRAALRVMRTYDILHLHEFHPLMAGCAIASGRRIVHTEHGTFQRANQATHLSAFVKKRLLGIPFLTYGPDAVVFISDWLQQDIGLRRAGTRVIHNGTTAKGAPRDAANGVFRVLTAARLEPRKRIDRLVRAFAAAARTAPMRLDVVGDGTAAAALAALAGELLPGDGYRFHGYCDDVSPHYSAADLFVLPADREAFGLVVVEAMHSGIPVICFRDGGGAVEIVRGVHDRLLVSDEGELSAAILYWRDHHEERREVGRRLRLRAEERFTVARMADDYLALYRQLAARTLAAADARAGLASPAG